MQSRLATPYECGENKKGWDDRCRFTFGSGAARRISRVCLRKAFAAWQLFLDVLQRRKKHK